jgi:hypothetical protein
LRELVKFNGLSPCFILDATEIEREL